jgi:hypothetical protein
MIEYALAGFLLVWLLVLSWIVYKVRKHYLNLVSRTKKQHLDAILDKLLDDDEKILKQQEDIKKNLENLAGQADFHLQKVGYVRYNPFERMGGEQSFAVAFLDRKDNGIVMNFIYTPDGMRVYTKIVKEGKGISHNLSEEEKKAIKESK